MFNKLCMRSLSQINTRPMSMLVGNRTGLLSNSIISQTAKRLPTALDITTPTFSIFQFITKRFLKVNFRITRLKKKRKFGFLARNKTVTGKKILAAKKKKGRRFLTY